MFTIKQITQSEDKEVSTKLFHSEQVTVHYSSDPIVGEILGEVDDDLVAIVMFDEKIIRVTSDVTVYVVNANGKTVQTV